MPRAQARPGPCSRDAPRGLPPFFPQCLARQLFTNPFPIPACNPYDLAASPARPRGGQAPCRFPACCAGQRPSPPHSVPFLGCLMLRRLQLPAASRRSWRRVRRPGPALGCLHPQPRPPESAREIRVARISGFPVRVAEQASPASGEETREASGVVGAWLGLGRGSGERPERSSPVNLAGSGTGSGTLRAWGRRGGRGRGERTTRSRGGGRAAGWLADRARSRLEVSRLLRTGGLERGGTRGGGAGRKAGGGRGHGR